MNWTNSPETEIQPGGANRLSRETLTPTAALQPETAASPEIRIDKSMAHSALPPTATSAEVFKMTLGSETIELIPQKNWSQLDHYKWTVRGKLPGEPAGLEVALDHVKICGESVGLADPAGCAKLQKILNEWLRIEKELLEEARKKAHAPHWSSGEAFAEQQSQAIRFRVEVDKLGQVHVHSVQGRNVLGSSGLTMAGFNSLIQQGLMRKPHGLKTGVLHDWVELDGELCSFEKGKNEAARLEQLLNDRYVPALTASTGKEVVIFLNPASSSGFDVQFPVKLAGAYHNQRQHLDDRSVELLQDREHCGLLHKGIIIKLIPPNIVVKQKTPDGGEQYLSPGPQHTVRVKDEDGQDKAFDLSHPINFMRLSPAELSAVFNHPAIHQHGKLPDHPVRAPGAAPSAAPQTEAARVHIPASPAPQPQAAQARAATPHPPPPPLAGPRDSQRIRVAVHPVIPPPNLWLKEILAQPALPPDWFSPLVYSKMALHSGNSSEGVFGTGSCWFISLGQCSDINNPAFKGIFLTEKGGLGFLNSGQMARFYHGVVFIGPRQGLLEGLHITLVGMARDTKGRVVFILNENFRAGFDDPETTLTDALNNLALSGALLMSTTELLASRQPIEIAWTVPAEQRDPSHPEALESTRPTA